MKNKEERILEKMNKEHDRLINTIVNKIYLNGNIEILAEVLNGTHNHLTKVANADNNAIISYSFCKLGVYCEVLKTTKLRNNIQDLNVIADEIINIAEELKTICKESE